DRLVVFGGEASMDGAHSAVWELDLSGTPTWRVITPIGEGPSPRLGASAVFDPWGDRMVVFGGYHPIEYLPCHSPLFDETWALSLAGTPTWTRLYTPTRPPGRLHHAAAIDP